jgi:soluble P-type ATPase
MKISFDYDDTLSTKKGSDLAKEFIAKGKEVYIISARNLKVGMIDKARSLGIPLNRVFATGSNENKIAKIKELGIEEHYDNNENVIKKLGSIGRLFKN